MSLKGPTRCFIRCSTKKLEEKGDKDIIAEVAKFAAGDPEKAFLLITLKAERRAYIVFDYGNPDHIECPVLGFAVKGHIKMVFAPLSIADYIHREVNAWKDINKGNKCPFPYRMELKNVRDDRGTGNARVKQGDNGTEQHLDAIIGDIGDVCSANDA